MKISLTLILMICMVFLSSCSTIPNEDLSKMELQLNIKTSNKYKEKIIESLLKDESEFTINFNSENSYILNENIFNSNLKHFCNSIIDDERKKLESHLFKNKKDKNKKVLIVYFKEFQEVANELKKKYPNEEYYRIELTNYDKQIKKILHVDSSIKKYSKLSELDKEIELSHSPRIRNDITNIYFLSNYDSGKTIVPIFRSYALNIDYFSTTEIFHNASDIKKLIDFENTFVPITNKMIFNISNKEGLSIKDELENSLIKDYLTVEKIYQNNLFKNNIIPDSGNIKIRKNSCINRDLNLWKVSTKKFTGQI